MYEIRRSSAARTAEQDMPESLSVAFGAYLEQLAHDPWAAGEPWNLLSESPDRRVGTFGFNGRGVALYQVHADTTPAYVLIVSLVY